MGKTIAFVIIRLNVNRTKNSVLEVNKKHTLDIK